MSKIKMLNLKGEEVKDKNLKDNIWSIEPNDAVLHNKLIQEISNSRQGTASTKTRSEVSGGGRKPWRQKGTGNARQGSIRATQWRGGGIVFGPNPNRNYKKKINKKEARLALKSALSYKVIDKELIVIDELKFDTNKTKEMVNVLNSLKLTDKKVLVVVSELSDNVCLACRNLANIKLVLPTEVNTYDVVNSDCMLMEESAIEALEEVLTRE